MPSACSKHRNVVRNHAHLSIISKEYTLFQISPCIHRVPVKSKPKCSCHIFYKIRSILKQFCVQFPVLIFRSLYMFSTFLNSVFIEWAKKGHFKSPVHEARLGKRLKGQGHNVTQRITSKDVTSQEQLYR